MKNIVFVLPGLLVVISVRFPRTNVGEGLSKVVRLGSVLPRGLS